VNKAENVGRLGEERTKVSLSVLLYLAGLFIQRASNCEAAALEDVPFDRVSTSSTYQLKAGFAIADDDASTSSAQVWRLAKSMSLMRRRRHSTLAPALRYGASAGVSLRPEPKRS
jgi:hypothetical protein